MLALALAAAACTATTPEPGRTTGAPTPSTDGTAGGTGNGGGSPDGRTDGGDGGGPDGRGDGSGSGSPGTLDHSPLGFYDERFLSEAIPRARIEIDSTGPELTARARNGLAGALQEHGSKAVTFAPQGAAPAQSTYDDDDLERIARATRDGFSTEDRVALHVLVLNGSYANADVLGLAFDASTFAIFPDRIRSGLLSSVNYAAFEEAVVVHELGHLFGLVNITGQGGFHEDPDHPGHSRNEGSVMFWRVDDISVGNIFQGGPPTTFDADDRREMAAIRE